MSENMLWFLIVELVAGWLAGILVKGGGFGLIGDLVVGVLGAFVGGWLFTILPGHSISAIPTEILSR